MSLSDLWMWSHAVNPDVFIMSAKFGPFSSFLSDDVLLQEHTFIISLFRNEGHSNCDSVFQSFPSIPGVQNRHAGSLLTQWASKGGGEEGADGEFTTRGARMTLETRVFVAVRACALMQVFSPSVSGCGSLLVLLFGFLDVARWSQEGGGLTVVLFHPPLCCLVSNFIKIKFPLEMCMWLVAVWETG